MNQINNSFFVSSTPPSPTRQQTVPGSEWFAGIQLALSVPASPTFSLVLVSSHETLLGLEKINWRLLVEVVGRECGRQVKAGLARWQLLRQKMFQCLKLWLLLRSLRLGVTQTG
ncbi:unnamed protein product [Brassica rapa subsp. trilocularis]